MQKPFEDLSREFAASIAEVVDAHAGTFDGQKVTGLALCPADDHLVPYLGVVFAGARMTRTPRSKRSMASEARRNPGRRSATSA